MSDFDKAKIGFALALLGVLFTLHPYLASAAGLDLTVFGVVLRFRCFYLSAAGLLSSAVYVYASDFLTEKPTSRFRKTGNILYAFALVVPPLYVGLWLLGQLEAALMSVVQSPKALSTITSILSLGAGIVAGFQAGRYQRLLRKRESADLAKTLEADEAVFITRAAQLIEVGHHDLAVADSFRAVEAGLSAAAFRGAGPRIAVHDLIDRAQALGSISVQVAEQARDLRAIRNRAVHDEGQIDRLTAEKALNLARSILGSIRPGPDDRDAA